MSGSLVSVLTAFGEKACGPLEFLVFFIKNTFQIQSSQYSPVESVNDDMGDIQGRQAQRGHRRRPFNDGDLPKMTGTQLRHPPFHYDLRLLFGPGKKGSQKPGCLGVLHGDKERLFCAEAASGTVLASSFHSLFLKATSRTNPEEAAFSNLNV
jgi:hypothetical protein